MNLTFLSPERVIGVWADLEDAYRGEHGYGGHVAEIYAFRLAVLTPIVASGSHDGPFGKPAFDQYCRQAGEALAWIIEEFKKRRECEITIEDEKMIEGGGFGHRIHVRVMPKGC